MATDPVTTPTTTTATTPAKKTLLRPRPTTTSVFTPPTDTSTSTSKDTHNHTPNQALNPDADHHHHPPTATPTRKMNSVVLSRPLGVYYARGFSSLSSFSSFFRLKPRIPSSSSSSSSISGSNNSSNSHIAKQQLHGQAAVGFRANTHCRFKSVSPLSPGASSASTSTTTVGEEKEEMTVKKVPMRGAVKIVEVGARDGLQNEQGVVPTETKIELIERLSGAGLRHIEAGSFVSPKWVPQMADTPQIHTHLNSHPPAAPVPVTYSYLTPNMQGLTSYLATPAPAPSSTTNQHTSEIAIFASASEGFSKQNINCTIAESLGRFRPVVERAREQGIAVRGYVSMVIECPYDGPTPPAKVADVVEELLKMGCYEVSLGDTNGVGTPGTVGTLVNYLIKERHLPAEKLAAHFHDTYGQAIVNCLVALEAGIRTFDSSIAGLGGCPYSKGATGNVATEDLVYFLEGTGVSTNVDLQKIVEIGDWISGVLGRRNDSKVGTALMARRGARL
ncbi:uncharacterized protein H6S33_002768 [Morchella sextelata]|uniref:uncharacterized protein n=1 Tax=Morchella sextelata TaxID=1174677 RepID=UPI001D059A82|nr:uncharacterized protein H6S33_002768 [Morchella sextelata]KAH0607734.1 hypothetical protein H6S33_002768 [Morchella sextelata]